MVDEKRQEASSGLTFQGIEIDFHDRPTTPQISALSNRLAVEFGGDWVFEEICNHEHTYHARTNSPSIYSPAFFDGARLLLDDRNIRYASPLFDLVGEALGQLQSLQPAIVYGVDNKEWHLQQLRAHEAWAYSDGCAVSSKGMGARIGHLDTGYTPHWEFIGDAKIREDSACNFVEGGKAIEPLDTIKDGHGTATASVIVSARGASDKNAGSTYVSGIAPAAELLPLRVGTWEFFFCPRNDVKGIDYAVEHNCDVISMSRGGFNSKSLRCAIDRALDNGVIVVSAPGNCILTCRAWAPARYEHVVCVGGSTVDEQPWETSSHGPEIDVCAPAHRIWRARTQCINDEYCYSVEPSSGTSYATALVAGIAALWVAHHGGRECLAQKLGGKPQIPRVFRELLIKTCRKPGGNWPTADYGAGIVDALALLQAPLTEAAKSTVSDSSPQTEAVFPGDDTDDVLLQQEMEILLMTDADVRSVHSDFAHHTRSLDETTQQLAALVKNKRVSSALREHICVKYEDSGTLSEQL